MHKHLTKWRADRGTRALKRFTEIEASITALPDDDLLDLADIFAESPATPLSEIAAAEMKRRDITL